jgi:hydroxymethylpyrimidine pyrophosphatase-like HAD family hydrolase
MNEYFRAIAVDFDGTLAEAGVPSESALAAIEEARAQGLRVVLVTGRILVELREVFPAVDRRFDAVVAENGAALLIGGSLRLLSAPVEFELDEALVERAVPFRRGQVLLATQAGYEVEIQEEIRRLGLECQLVHNRGELMILPPGIAKGFGLHQALASLGISPHNALGVGDAENDHSLLSVCEIGAAVGNAVDGLKRHADVVLEEHGGEGVAALLRRSVLGSEAPLRPRRWRLELGRFIDGGRATIPASQINMLVTGRSKAGKSFVGGALAERLIELGYSVCLIDPEGDYVPLGELHGVECLGGAGQPPDIEQVRRFIAHRFGSVIVDLSLVDSARHAVFTQALLRALATERQATGLPHWIIIDEAHHALGLPGELLTALDQGQKGYCLMTYQPQVLAEHLCGSMDVVVALPGGKRLEGPDPVAEIDRLCGLKLADCLDRAGQGQAVLVQLERREARMLSLAPRRTAHVRHWHKYLRARLPPRLRFVFRRPGEAGGTPAANIEEFHDLVRAASAEALAFHARQGDFSRWIAEAVQDEMLARTIRPVEQQFSGSGHTDGDIGALRDGVVTAIERRYGDE